MMDIRENMEVEQCEVAEEMLISDKVSTLFWLNKDENFVAVQISPASRVAIGEYFGLSHGEDGIGKVAAVLRELGADAVVDTAIAEDAVTILETKKLLANKADNQGKTLISSRCAAFVQMAKEKYPSLCVSDVPATASVCGALLKEFYKEQTGKRVYVIAVEPCFANKNLSGADLILTTEELVSILAETEINLRLEKNEALDEPFGTGSGSGYICGVSGGVAEGIARCLSEDKSQEAVRKFSYSGLYSEKKVREITLTIDGAAWKFAVVCGLAAAEEVLARVEKGEVFYDYVEVLACSGGCVGGDGQACVVGENESLEYAAKLRARALKQIENKRATKAADMNATAITLARAWSDLERGGIAQEEPIDWETLFAETALQFLTENAVLADDEEVCEEDVCPCVCDEAETECPCEEETVCEEVVEETPAEEPIEESPVEEILAEESIEVTAEIAIEEEEEEIPEEIPEEIFEEIEEEIIEEIPEIIEEDSILEADSIEEALALPVEDVAETAAEEIVEEVMDEEVEDIEEEAEELVQSGKAPIDPYHRRLSGRDRRKLKRQRKNK